MITEEVEPGPWYHVAPFLPGVPAAPVGIVKLRIAAEAVPLFVTEAFEPTAPVVVVPTAIVAGVPAGPCYPSVPLFPGEPVAPFRLIPVSSQ